MSTFIHPLLTHKSRTCKNCNQNTIASQQVCFGYNFVVKVRSGPNDQVVKEFTSALEISVDLSGRNKVNDGCLEALAEADVTWKELNLSGTSVTGNCISKLCEKCPHFSVK